MLVLTRRQGESVRIGNDVVVKVLGVDRGKVRVGIEAPKDVLVLRSELTPDGRAGAVLERTG